MAVDPYMESRDEGLFDQQLSLALPSQAAPAGLGTVRLRDGSETPFDRTQIADSIFEAARTVEGENRDLAESLASAVEIYLYKRFHLGGVPTVDHVHDAVERVLIQMSHARTALAYARRRDRRARIRRLREGDLAVLFSELEEARHEREAREALGESVLFSHRGGEREFQWDRERLARSLAREAGLSAEQADAVSKAVERQIIQAGIRRVTAGLVREMTSAELLDRGWRESHERRRQLGLPLYDMENLLRGRTPDTVAQHPGATDEALAQAVKREYALARVLPAEVADAHLRGDLHVSGLPTVDRIGHATHALAYVARHGVWAPGGRQLAAPANHGDTLLAHMVKWDELMRQYTSGAVRWSAINVYFAPFLYGLEGPELRQFAQMLLYEYAYRALANPGPRPPAELEIVWSVPETLRALHVSGPGGEMLTETYGDFEHTAQQFAWALVEEVQAAAAEGAPLPAPWPVVCLEGACLKAAGQDRFIGLTALAVASGAPVEVRFMRDGSPSPAQTWEANQVSLPPVTLNLARAAYRAGTAGEINAQIETSLALAVQAHRARRAFLEVLCADRNAPLGFLAYLDAERRYVNLDLAVSPIAVEGLRECVAHLTGSEPGESAEALAFAESLLTRLRERCDFFSRREGFPIVLTENDENAISHRFATADLALYPEMAALLPSPPAPDGLLAYSTGVTQGGSAKRNPWEQAMLEGRLKSLLYAAAPVYLALPDTNMSADSIASFIARLYRDSPCTAVVFRAAG